VTKAGMGVFNTSQSGKNPEGVCVVGRRRDAEAPRPRRRLPGHHRGRRALSRRDAETAARAAATDLSESGPGPRETSPCTAAHLLSKAIEASPSWSSPRSTLAGPSPSSPSQPRTGRSRLRRAGRQARGHDGEEPMADAAARCHLLVGEGAQAVLEGAGRGELRQGCNQV
jgi:hypothetical protein